MHPTRTIAARTLWLLLLWPSLACATEAPTEKPITAEGSALTLTFLGNEGFLITCEDHKILIDALTGQDRNFVWKSDDLRQRLRTAGAPFDDVDLVLASHVHHDHFDADEVSEYLLANPTARFVSTPQAVDRLRRTHPAWDDVRDRVRGEYPAEGQRTVLSGLPFDVELLRLHHGLTRRPRTENLGLLIDVCGFKLLHIGDTEATEDEFAPYKLRAEAIDIALVPSWFFVRPPWKGVLEKEVRPRHLVMMHLAPGWHQGADGPNQRQARERVEAVAKTHPNAIVFREPLEQHIFER